MTVNTLTHSVVSSNLMQWFSTCAMCTTDGTLESPNIFTLWWYLERQIFSEVVPGVKRLRTMDTVGVKDNVWNPTVMYSMWLVLYLLQ